MLNSHHQSTTRWIEQVLQQTSKWAIWTEEVSSRKMHNKCWTSEQWMTHSGCHQTLERNFEARENLTAHLDYYRVLSSPIELHAWYPKKCQSEMKQDFERMDAALLHFREKKNLLINREQDQWYVADSPTILYFDPDQLPTSYDQTRFFLSQ